MARLTFPEPTDVPEPARRQLDRFPINLTRMLLHVPQSVEPYVDLAYSLLHGGRLDPRVREFVILRVASVCGSEYEQTQHLPSARKAGLTEEEIAAAHSGDPGALSPDLAMAMRFTDECVVNVEVGEETFREARALFAPQDVAELTLLIGFYAMTARFLRTLAVDIDPPTDLSSLH
jgi:alkylhydroperoxidase family enzyme